MGSRHGAAAALALAAATALAPAAARGEPVAVAHWEGVTLGFLSLRSLDGALLADGELTTTTKPAEGANRVTSRLVLRFKDGSRHEETTVYVQRRTFRLVRNHLVQKGPAFKNQLEATISASGRVHVRWVDEDGKENRADERMQLPPDLANGLLMPILKNISPSTPKTTVSYVALTPKPQLVKLELVPTGEDRFSTGSTERKAVHYVVKVDVPGVKGALASLLGKTPPDSHVWIAPGEAPGFVRAEMTLFTDGPMWRIETLAPAWPKDDPAAASAEAKDPGASAAERSR